jgi:hypothetical protein
MDFLFDFFFFLFYDFFAVVVSLSDLLLKFFLELILNDSFHCLHSPIVKLES